MMRWRWMVLVVGLGCGPIHAPSDAGRPDESADRRPPLDAAASADRGAAPPPAAADAANAAADGAAVASRDVAPELGPQAVDEALPLSTCGRWIVDRHKRRVKLASVNWYGASDTELVPGGLDRVTAAQVARTIRELDFNSVRLPFSNEMLRMTTPVAAAHVAGDPSLAGKTPIEVLDASVAALTEAGLLVILNNHSTHAMWCCNYDDDGLWYTREHSEEQWIADWEWVLGRYASNPRVVGADLRNELRIAKPTTGILPRIPTWGTGGMDDWHRAATAAGNRILAKHPDLLIIVEGLNSADDLTGVAVRPVRLSVPNKVVYQSHQYSFFRPGLPAIPGLGGTYGSMSATALAEASRDQWGFVVEPGRPSTAPLWVGEFGDSASSDPRWLTNLVAYLRTLDADFAYWALNGGPKAAGGPEPFGLVDDDWTTVRRDWRLTLLQSIQKPTRGPGITPGDACP